MTHVKHPLLLSCLSLCLLAACSKKDADPGATKDEAKAPAEPSAATDSGTVEQAAAPKGKDAPGNLEPIVKAAMAVSDCKFDERNEYLDNDCTAFDALGKAIDDQGETKVSAPTLVNLLAEQSDAVRWAAADSLARGGWQDDAALVATVIVALGTENHTGVSQALGNAMRDVEDKLLETPQVLAAYQGALAAQADHDRFEVLLEQLYDCDAKPCNQLFLHAAKHNPDLQNRSHAADELMNVKLVTADSCSVIAEIAIALSQAKPVDDEAEFQPHAEAGDLIADLRDISVETEGKTQDCAAELPKLLDEAVAQANAGTLDRDVFYSLLDIDSREDKATYMAKLETLAKAVDGNAKFDEDMHGTAKDALEDWKKG